MYVCFLVFLFLWHRTSSYLKKVKRWICVGRVYAFNWRLFVFFSPLFHLLLSTTSTSTAAYCDVRRFHLHCMKPSSHVVDESVFDFLFVCSSNSDVSQEGLLNEVVVRETRQQRRMQCSAMCVRTLLWHFGLCFFVHVIVSSADGTRVDVALYFDFARRRESLLAFDRCKRWLWTTVRMCVDVCVDVCVSEFLRAPLIVVSKQALQDDSDRSYLRWVFLVAHCFICLRRSLRLFCRWL